MIDVEGTAAQRDLIVIGKRKVANHVVLVDLARPDGSDLPAWSAGAHVSMQLRPGLVRQYSLCGDPTDRSRWQIAVLLEPAGRGGSKFIHDSLRERATVLVADPQNHFPLVDAERYLFVAGGIGITPIKVMIATAHRAGIPWTATYGGRSRRSMAFLESLRTEYGDRVDVKPQDEVGLLNLDQILSDRDPGTLVYCCGPESLINAVEARSEEWPEGTLHVERFKSRSVPPSLSQGYEVVLGRSEITLFVPAGRALLDVIEEAGVKVACSCREGTCGMCETKVMAGEIEHRDSWLTTKEQAAGATMMICVSHAAGPKLVLDL